ncbi:MAG: zinc ABC transporter substrate-binding protein [Proteobacteria bacterium]|nr:zinc ABC transporter substrate-binding protein [Pseudomonadota bacterium]
MFDRRTFIALIAATGSTQFVYAQTSTPLPVLASFSILGDMARQIGGPRVAVTDIVGANQDAHGFQPSPDHVKMVAGAKVILVNGFGYEPFIARLIKTSGSKVQPTVVSRDVKPLVKAKDSGHGHEREHGGGHDPHAWQSISNAKRYAAAIASAFSAADPAGAADYGNNLKAYIVRLDTLIAEAQAVLGAIPQDNRLLVTTHDSFRYFAAEFGFRTAALQGISAESEPSAADMAKIIRQLRTLKAPAVFIENVSDPRKIEQIGRESGAKVGGTLYSDALSLANGPAATYIDMMRHNVREIAKVLTP